MFPNQLIYLNTDCNLLRGCRPVMSYEAIQRIYCIVSLFMECVEYLVKYFYYSMYVHIKYILSNNSHLFIDIFIGHFYLKEYVVFLDTQSFDSLSKYQLQKTLNSIKCHQK